MQSRMLALDGFLRRHRRLVLLAWLLVLVAAVPFALRQSDHLTGGGFRVPGSDSETVEAALARDFAGGERATLAAVLVAREGARAADYRAALDDLRAGVARTPDADLAAAAAARAARRAERGPRAVVVQLDVGVSEDEASDVAIDLREELGIGGAASKGEVDDAPHRPGRAVGRPAGALQGGSRGRRDDGLPDRRAHPAGRLRVAGRGGAAARARPGLRPGHRRADPPALALDGDVGLRHEHGLDDRHRRGRRLLAVRPGALPRGDPRGRRAARGARPRAGHLGAGRRCSAG